MPSWRSTTRRGRQPLPARRSGRSCCRDDLVRAGAKAFRRLPHTLPCERQRERECSKHLLGLVNTVLDIAKIESGQFTLNMGESAIGSVVETVRAATESLAQNKKLTLTTSVD